MLNTELIESIVSKVWVEVMTKVMLHLTTLMEKLERILEAAQSKEKEGAKTGKQAFASSILQAFRTDSSAEEHRTAARSTGGTVALGGSPGRYKSVGTP